METELDPISICQDGDFPEGMIEELQQFLNNNPKLGDTFSTGRLFPLQRMAEWKKMLHIANSIKPTTIVEIGSDKGGSVIEWCLGVPTIKRMIAIEIRGIPYITFLQKSFPSIDFLGLSESSLTRQCVEKVKNWLGSDKIDVLFVDGDKSFYYQDGENYLPLMNSPSLIFFHDIQDGPTGDAFRRFSQRGYRASEIIDKSEWIESEKRELQGIPPKHAHEAWLRTWRGKSCGVGCIFLP